MSTPTEAESKPATPTVDDTPMTAVEDEIKSQDLLEQKQQGLDPEPVDLEKLRANFQEKAKTYLIEQSRHVIIPSFSKWFDMNEVHSIERKLFPDFFPAKTSDGSTPSAYKTPEVYKNMRDFMINTYRINPIEYLTVTAVRRNLSGDVASIIRIHRFLEKWGLINYQIDPRTKPSLVGPQYTGHFQVTLDTPKGLAPFVPENVQIKTESSHNGHSTTETAQPEALETKTVSSSEVIPINIELTRNIFEENKNAKNKPSVSYFCNETSNDVSDVRYHNLRSKTLVGGSMGPLVISQECYEQGLFPLNFTASDFVKMEGSTVQDEWTQQETLLLLEGIEMYASIENNPQSMFVNSNGQWDRISEHVASKTREQCLTKFLQMPIEDRYLQKLVKSEKSSLPEESISKETIIQEVVEKLIASNEGKDIVSRNSTKNLEESVLNQTNLINQVIELTLEKFSAKMKHLGELEADLVKKENMLSSERKQVLIERWLNFEKLSKFKQQNTNPDLVPLLDDLLTPVNINEINKKFSSMGYEDSSEVATTIANDQEESLPVSVAKPKAYLFWSA